MAAPTDDGVDDRLTAVAMTDADMAKLIPTLPIEMRYPPFPLRRFRGVWLLESLLPGVAAVHTRFEPRPDDVFLASFPKSGTTWLKALAFAAVNRDRHPPSDPDHPLRRSSPHECVRFFELAFALADKDKEADLFAHFPSPRVIGTHLPYNLLPERVKAAEAGAAGCRVVYVCRDPKDAFVSLWFFKQKVMAAAVGDVRPTQYTLEEAFELFCDGRCLFGPQWRHVLGYWEASRRWPDKVLFLRYEEMLGDPAGTVKRLAEFLGCPFSGEEEESGMVDAVVKLCSLESLKASARVSGPTETGVENGIFFRKGLAGDWRNHLTPEMASRLDGIVAEELQGSAFTFGIASDTSAPEDE